MLKKVTLAIAMLAVASMAFAASFDAQGTVFEPTHDYSYITDRVLVNDGSFEDGTCAGGSGWTCTTDGACDWIVNLVDLGLWNYDGVHIAWLGGFCGGLATCFTSFCQNIFVDGATLSWWWMGYVNDAVSVIDVTVGGDNVYSIALQLSDHLLDYQNQTADIGAYVGGNHEICFLTDNPNCASNLGDNYFMDFVELLGGTATEGANFSTVKALY